MDIFLLIFFKVKVTNTIVKVKVTICYFRYEKLPFFEKIYKIDKNRKKLKIGIDNCPGICYYLQVVMRRKFIRYAEVSELADEQD